MAIWYDTGTIAVANGARTVTGTGTQWVGAVNPGDAIHTPDERQYQVVSVDSNTQLTLSRDYLGASVSGADYEIQPTRALTQEYVSVGQSLFSQVEQYIDGVLAGKFPAGTIGAPPITAAADPDTGVRFPGGNEIEQITGGARRTLLGTTSYRIDVPITGTAVQSGYYDEDSTKLSLVGAFGLGGRTSAEALNDGEVNRPSGFYAGGGGAADLAKFPSNGSRYNPILNLTRNNGGGDYASIRMFFDTATPYVRRRADAASAWSAPNKLFGTANILSAVSQSGGVPTGGMIERGSNSNGEYVRFADGTQICWHALDLDYVNSVTLRNDWTFPAAFSSTGRFVSLATHRLNGNPPPTSYRQGVFFDDQTSVNQATTARLAMLTQGSFSNEGQLAVRAMAVGRWFN